MTKLEEMWVELAKYQSKANDEGHGKTWVGMCRLKTEKAAFTASTCAYVKGAAAACNAAYSAYGAEAAYLAGKAADRVDYWAQKAIEHINKALKEQEKQND